MPSNTADKTRKPNPQTSPAYAPAENGYGRGPTRVDAVTAMLRYPLLVIIPVIVLAVVGYVLAGKKHTTYKAESQVLIGSPAPGSAGQLPGLVQAEQALAGIYAREIDFDQVLTPLARQLGTSTTDIASRLSAAPDPQSPLIRIFATGPTAAKAVALANGAATKFASSMNAITQNDASTTHAATGYKRAVIAYQKALAKQHRIQQNLADSGSDTSTSSSPALLNAIVATQVAQLHQATLASQYQTLLASQSSSSTLSVFESAAGATTNHSSNLEIYVFGGVLAGLLIGGALATLLANRKSWRDARFD
jgi:capsular polysaccharide biosynthesis protein